MAKQYKSKVDIKSLEPRKGKIRQGYFHPKNPDKYVGDLDKIIYRSSWELKFLQFCDMEDRVIKYSVELYSVPYINPLTKTLYHYNIDFYCEILTNSERVEKWLIEVKPKKFIVRPKPPKTDTAKSLQTYKANLSTYFVNEVKFEAARRFAKENDMHFGILTEKFAYKNMI